MKDIHLHLINTEVASICLPRAFPSDSPFLGYVVRRWAMQCYAWTHRGNVACKAAARCTFLFHVPQHPVANERSKGGHLKQLLAPTQTPRQAPPKRQLWLNKIAQSPPSFSTTTTVTSYCILDRRLLALKQVTGKHWPSILESCDRGRWQ